MQAVHFVYVVWHKLQGEVQATQESDRKTKPLKQLLQAFKDEEEEQVLHELSHTAFKQVVPFNLYPLLQL